MIADELGGFSPRPSVCSISWMRTACTSRGSRLAWDVGRQGLYLVDPEAKPRPVIELFDFATRRVIRIAELDRPPVRMQPALSVARDERSILYTQQDQSGSDVVMVEGFR